MSTRQSFRTMINFAGAQVPVEVIALYDEPEDDDSDELLFICPHLTVIYDNMIINDFVHPEDFIYLQEAVEFKIRTAEAQRVQQASYSMEE